MLLNNVAVALREPQADFFSDRPRERLCRPAKGRSLGASVQEFSAEIRHSVSTLEANQQAFSSELTELLGGRTELDTINEHMQTRLAWFAINVALLHAFSTGRATPAPLTQCANWFFGGKTKADQNLLHAFAKGVDREVDGTLTAVQVSADLLDLIPYVLESHGHVTRRQLERDPSGPDQRERKRRVGVYYTPSDVAEFMVREVGSYCDWTSRWLDPACGSGVFLRTRLRQFFDEHDGASATDGLKLCGRSLFGLDLSALATESCVFVLLIECASRGGFNLDPFASWKLIARNILPCNSTRVRPGIQNIGVPDLLANREQDNTLRSLFPEVVDGFDCVVMNPPYSTIPVDHIMRAHWDSFAQIPNGAKCDLALAFVEMMWRFTHKDGVAVAVLPLSVGVSTQTQYKACRRAMTKAGGSFEFLFFDREPHALFGEDIKTRNAIIFRNGASGLAVHTSRLLKWTSSLRPSIFSRTRAVNLIDNNIATFVPKLGSREEVEIYRKIKSHAQQRSALTPNIGRTRLENVTSSDNRTLFVSPTAYNFLNCFLPCTITGQTPNKLSDSPIHALIFASTAQRDAGFALLTSTIAFWLWHVEGDGFHVTADFLRRLPIWSLPEQDDLPFLATCGIGIWQCALVTKVRSLNGGKVTFSFHCPYSNERIVQVDDLLFARGQIPKRSSDSLKEFVSKTVSIDGAVRRRISQ